MTCKLILREHGATDVGPWWSKFYHQTAQELGVVRLMTKGEINKKLKEYHAKYVSADIEVYLEFDDEQYVSLFLLRYS